MKAARPQVRAVGERPGLSAAHGRLRSEAGDYLSRQHMHLDVGALGRREQELEGLVGPAPLLCHQDALGVLDDRHRVQPGLQPRVRGAVQDAPPVARPEDVSGRLQSRLGLGEPPCCASNSSRAASSRRATPDEESPASASMPIKLSAPVHREKGMKTRCEAFS